MVIPHQPLTSHTPVEPGRRQRRREETSEKLFLAAMELFSHKGFAQTTVEEITQAADVGKGTFFNYFPSKEHVLGYLVGKQSGTVQHHLELAQEGKMNSEEILASLGRGLMRLPGKSPQMARNLIRAFLGNIEVREHIVREMTEKRRWITEIIQLGQERGELNGRLPAAELARAFHHALFGTVLLWALDPSSSLEKQFDNTMTALFSGFNASPEQLRATRRNVRSRAAKSNKEAR
jgi:AcrR family transcriptional regulator